MKALLKVLLYNGLELATLGRGVPRLIGGEPIRFPPRWSRYYPENYEPATFLFLKKHCTTGQTVLDIGAHLGLFSVVMARLVGPEGRVFCFEPTERTRRALQRTIRLNHCEDIVEVRSEAVTQTTGTAIFHQTGEILSNANSLIHTDRSRHGTKVNTISVDGFVRDRKLQIGCMKIDVEGAEIDLLRGAADTFLRLRPPTLLALHPAAIKSAGRSLREGWDLLQSYRMKIFDGGNPLSQEIFCNRQDLFDVQLLPEG